MFKLLFLNLENSTLEEMEYLLHQKTWLESDGKPPTAQPRKISRN